MKKKKTTIEELEKILNEDSGKVYIKPNGELTVNKKEQGKPQILTMKKALGDSY